MAMDSRRAQWVVWNDEQGLADSEQAQARNNIGAAALLSLAPAFSTSTAYNENNVVTYNGALYVFTADKAAGAWDGTKATETTIWEVLQMAEEKPTTIVNTPIYKDTSGTGDQLYTYANNARTASVGLAADISLVMVPKSHVVINGAVPQINFAASKVLKIRKVRIATPGSEGAASALGKMAAVLYLMPYGVQEAENGSAYVVRVTQYNKWEQINLEVDVRNFESTSFYFKMLGTYTENGETLQSVLNVDDYNLQSAYEGQKLQAWLELEVESDSIA